MSDRIDLADRVNDVARRARVLRLAVAGIAGEFSLSREIDGLAELALGIADELNTIADEICPDPGAKPAA